MNLALDSLSKFNYVKETISRGKNLFFVVLIFSSVSLFSQNKVDEIDKLINYYSDNGYLNGAVLVAEGGEIIYKRAAGNAVMSWNVPNNIDSKFQLFSVSKQFTALIALQLVNEGKIDLNGTISDYLPYYRKDNGKRIKIHHLITHTHGIIAADWNSIPPG